MWVKSHDGHGDDEVVPFCLGWLSPVRILYLQLCVLTLLLMIKTSALSVLATHSVHAMCHEQTVFIP